MSKISNPEKAHFTLVGRKNVGKSTLIRCLTNEVLSSVDEISRTTTDLVNRKDKLFPYDIFVMVDIASIDYLDESVNKGKDKTTTSLLNADLTILVLDARMELDEGETELITYLQKMKLPFAAAVNKIELGTNPNLLTELEALEINYFEISCKECAGIEALKRELFHHLSKTKN